MPLLTQTSFKPNIFFKNTHFNTLYRFIFSTSAIDFKRERMTTNDADFIDLDISSVQSESVIIAIHGLEGSSKSSYIQSLTVCANKNEYDVVVMNLRGCSGEPNKLLSSYHSGKTDDLKQVIDYIIKKKKYKCIHIVGYSLGGNLALKLMGEFGKEYPEMLKTAIGISVPCDLEGSSKVLNRGFNKCYQYGILKSLLKKAKHKLNQFPDSGIQKEKLFKVSDFKDFDEFFTAPLNSFSSAKDYYTRSSCKPYLEDIKVSSMMIAALDDSFLSTSCYPFKEAKENDNFSLLTPKYGGHVGFYSGFNKKNNYWLEEQIISFIQN
ncbi:MAG TPA: alpha/beta fold hydrolase [Lutibacter sp.]|nr:alpha/beta fold hydrolase [Lutibacter sp.]